MIILLAQSTLLLAPLVESGSTPTQPEETVLSIPELQEPSLFSGWSGKASLGLTLIGGNNESTTGSAGFSLDWSGKLDELGFGAQYSGDRTTDKTTGNATTNSRLYQYDAGYKRFWDESKDWYGYASAALRQDQPNGLQSRTSGGIGVGHRFTMFDNAEGSTFEMFQNSQVNIELGAAYVTENKVGTLSDSSGVARAAYDLATPLAETMDFTAAGVYLNGGDVETYIQDFGLSYHLNESWSLEASVNIAYDANPSAGFGTTDRRYVLALSTTF